MFNNPNAIVADSHSNLFVWDSNNYRIRKIAPDGTVTTFAGGGSNSSLPATGTNAYLFGISRLIIDRNDTLWASGTHSANAGLWKITSGAVVTFTNFTFTGSGNGTIGLCADSVGNIYFSTTGNQIYRYATNGVSGVFVGSGNSGAIDGNGVFTSFSGPNAMTCDSADNIYIYDTGSSLMRKIDQSRNVVTIAGLHSGNFDGSGTNTGFGFGSGAVTAMCSDNSGNIYLACTTSIRKMDAATNVVTMAGNFTQNSYTNGAGNLSRFNNASGVCLSQGSIFVADSGNQRIRQISFNPQPQVVTGANLGIGTFSGVTITGTVGRTYQVQSSPDMSAWTTRATLLLTASPFLWIDQTPVSGNKFYRALLLP
jgi:sugar lactone lactonase YvrE